MSLKHGYFPSVYVTSTIEYINLRFKVEVKDGDVHLGFISAKTIFKVMLLHDKATYRTSINRGQRRSQTWH